MHDFSSFELLGKYLSCIIESNLIVSISFLILLSISYRNNSETVRYVCREIRRPLSYDTNVEK